MGCIDNANTGHVLVVGEEVQKLSDDALSDFRAKDMVNNKFRQPDLYSVCTLSCLSKKPYKPTLCGDILKFLFADVFIVADFAKIPFCNVQKSLL